MPAPEIIIQKVQQFELHRDQYRSPAFSEAEARVQFIDPFFKALGWDMDNTQAFAEQYKEVVHEDKLKVGDATKAPDYSFRIGKERKFFVEAKKPEVDIAHGVEPAYQFRRYAWSAKLPLSILTDFEELSVYECRTKPDHTDKASTGCIIKMTYRRRLARCHLGRRRPVGRFAAQSLHSKLSRVAAHLHHYSESLNDRYAKNLRQ